MKQIIALVMGGAVLTACATTNSTSTSAGGGALATSAFDYAPTREGQVRTPQFGYSLVGAHGDWTAALAYEEGGAAPVVVMAFDRSGQAVEADLDIAMPYLSGGVRQFSGDANTGSPVEVTLQAGPCTDGQSSETYSHFATVIIGRGIYRGCANEESTTDRWSNYVAEYLTAIDTCLAELRTEAEHVTIAYPVSDATGVRLSNRIGQRWECVTRDGNRSVNALRTLDAGDVMLGEGDPIFIRSSVPQAGEGCYVYESVRSASGDLIGSFGFDSCATPSGPIG